ncbi:ferredoxin [Candidatus Woesearchaeota archaeon]|nr:ferredoxin [Candidatus Woesearchaeota archaeon]
MKYKIVHRKDECIGCGACVAADPAHWKMNSENKAELIGAKKVGETEESIIDEKEVDDVRQAAEVCPVRIIEVRKV